MIYLIINATAPFLVPKFWAVLSAIYGHPLWSRDSIIIIYFIYNYFNLFIRSILIIDEYFNPHMIEFPDLFQIC